MDEVELPRDIWNRGVCFYSEHPHRGDDCDKCIQTHANRFFRKHESRYFPNDCADYDSPLLKEDINDIMRIHLLDGYPEPVKQLIRDLMEQTTRLELHNPSQQSL